MPKSKSCCANTAAANRSVLILSRQDCVAVPENQQAVRRAGRHIRMEAKRTAVESLAASKLEPPKSDSVLQEAPKVVDYHPSRNAQIVEKYGEPGGTRTQSGH